MSSAASQVDASVSTARVVAAREASAITPASLSPDGASNAMSINDLHRGRRRNDHDGGLQADPGHHSSAEQPFEEGEAIDLEEPTSQAISRIIARRWQLNTFQYLIDSANFASGTTRRTLSTGADLLTDKDTDRLATLFGTEAYVGWKQLGHLRAYDRRLPRA